MYSTEFTKLYSLSKTLRFELKPVGETQKFLEKNKLIPSGRIQVEEDEDLDRLYQNDMKIMYDQMHNLFIADALSRVHFDETDLNKINEAFLELKKLKKDTTKDLVKTNRIKELQGKNDDDDKAIIPQLLTKLRLTVVNSYQSTAKVWKEEKFHEAKLTKNDWQILVERNSLKILAKLFVSKIDVINRFDQFTGYFEGFHLNRSNYYKSESKQTSIANRVINENKIR